MATTEVRSLDAEIVGYADASVSVHDGLAWAGEANPDDTKIKAKIRVTLSIRDLWFLLADLNESSFTGKVCWEIVSAS